jgi:hypothetical protein
MESHSKVARFANGFAFRWTAGVALAAALVAAPAFGQVTHDDNVKEGPVAADQVAANPQIYLGKRIVVEGYVDDQYGTRAFTIEKMAKLGADDVGTERSGSPNHGHDLLVYVPQSVAMTAIEKNKKIRVSGTIQRGLTAPADEIGNAKDLNDRAVLVADSITVE